MTADLIVHAGGWRVTREEVEAVPVPEPDPERPQWNPLPYADFLGMIDDSFRKSAMPLDWNRSQFALAGKDGGRFFGVVPVDALQAEADWVPTVGLRQSYDSSFAAEICLGSRVFVCDNLAFTADIRIGFKNTTNIRTELPERLREGTAKFARWSEGQAAEIKQMKAVRPSDWERDHMIVEAVRRGACPPSKIGKVIEEFDRPRHEEFAGQENAWRLFNAFTQIAAERSPEQQFRSGGKLITIFRDHCLKDKRQELTAEVRQILEEMEREGRMEFDALVQQPLGRH